MKKIVIDARESGTSTGRYVDKLIEYLHKLKPEFEFVILTKPHRLKYLRQIAPNFKIVESNHKEFTFDEQLGFKKQIKKLRPDLAHFLMVQQPVFYRGKVVTTMQDLTTVRFRNPDKNPMIFVLKQQIYKWVNKKAARKSAAIITPSKFVKQDVVDFTGVDPGKITVTYEAADKIMERPEPLLRLEGKEFILFVGRPSPHKNLERLVKAFALVKQTHPQLILVLAGKLDANYLALQKRVERRGIEDVIFTDFVTEGELRWLYEHTKAYVFPSMSEGFGLPSLEAMAHGAPVVSSNATCLPEVNGKAAHYFNPKSVGDMACAISEVLDDARLARNLIIEGSLQVKNYSWEKMAKQTLEVYKKVLG